MTHHTPHTRDRAIARSLLRRLAVRGAPPTTCALTADAAVWQNAVRQVARGRNTFRFDTFGDQEFWGGALRLHEAIAGAANGGVGPGLSPKAALGLGLKVDAKALPAPLVEQLKAGRVNLDDPAVTLALLKLNAVVGVRGFTDRAGELDSVGITCALCHSTVDDSLAPGIGARLTAGRTATWTSARSRRSRRASRRSRNCSASTRRPYARCSRAGGPGKFDAELLLDGKAFRPDGAQRGDPDPAGVRPRGREPPHLYGLGLRHALERVRRRARDAGQGHVLRSAARRREQVSDRRRERLRQRAPRARPRDAEARRAAVLSARDPGAAAAARAASTRARPSAAQALFAADGKARCASCHVPPLYTEPGFNLHEPEEIGIDAFQAQRGPEDGYRTTPLRGLWTHTKGGFYHDGRFATLLDVVDHYDSFQSLGLNSSEKLDLVEFLKSL